MAQDRDSAFTPTVSVPMLVGMALFSGLTPLPNDDNAKLQVGTLEGSNVNPIEAMVGMIQTARQFETQMKLMQTAEANEKAASQLLSGGA